MKKIFHVLMILFPLFSWAGKSSIELAIGEEKHIPGGPKIRLDSVGHESASSGPGEKEEVYAVFHFTLTAHGKTGKVSAPVETESAPYQVWDNYLLKVIEASKDNKRVSIILKKK